MKEKEKREKLRKLVLSKIVERRKALGIAQMDLALMLNMSFNGYYKVERGKTKLDTYRLFQILDLLEISPEDFFKGMK